MVVIRIAPFAARVPYKAVADGPLRTVTLSMSSGLMFDIPSLDVIPPPSPYVVKNMEF